MDRVFHPCIQRFADQGMADGDFKHIGDGFKEFEQIGLAQVVAGIDSHAQSLRLARGVDAIAQRGGGIAAGVCFCLRAGVDFNPVRTNLPGQLQPAAAGIHEQAHAAAE